MRPPRLSSDIAKSIPDCELWVKEHLSRQPRSALEVPGAGCSIVAGRNYTVPPDISGCWQLAALWFRASQMELSLAQGHAHTRLPQHMTAPSCSGGVYSERRLGTAQDYHNSGVLNDGAGDEIEHECHIPRQIQGDFILTVWRSKE